jgi:aminoglycoside 3-N-acetyltransferase
VSVLDLASGWARRHLPDARFDHLREVYLRLRGRMAPLYRARYGSFDAAALRAHLEQRVPPDFKVLMVHSSVNGMQPMLDGTPLDLLRMLLDFTGPQRTLVMPTFYFGEPGLGTVEAFRAHPRVDLLRTPSQMGLVTELFRRLPGVRSSRHPAYRITALGPEAEALVAGHEHADSAAGSGTPFDYMARVDATILGVGKNVQVLTQAHHVEQSMGERFPVASRPAAPLPMTLVERGVEIPFELRAREVDGQFDILRIRRLVQPGTLEEWAFHGVPMFLTRAGAVTRDLIAAAERGQTLYEPRSGHAATRGRA